MALIERYDNVKISVRDDPVQKLIEMEEVARQLRAYDTDINLTGSHTLLKFVNALPPQYNHQRQSMEEHDTLRREIVVGLVRKRFESTLFKQELAKGKKIPSGDQALAAKGEPGKPGGGRRRGKPKKSQDPGRDGGGGRKCIDSAGAVAVLHL